MANHDRDYAIFTLVKPASHLRPVVNADRRYRLGIRSAVRGLWKGALTFEQARSSMNTTIVSGLTRAFHRGLEDVGIQPSEMTAEETRALNQLIQRDQQHMESFLRDIQEMNRERAQETGWDEGTLGAQLSRADMWINRFDEAENLARQMAGKNEKLKWTVNPVKEHCVDCLKLDQKVKRASQWKDYGIRPQSESLACGGFNCGCSLDPTDEPMSFGPLPKITGSSTF